MTSLRIDSIEIGERHRVEMGDIASLARSIEEIGLLHPIVVTPELKLIAGQRRMEAFRQLGRAEIPCTVIDLEEVIKGEWAENAERKPFTPSEAYAITQVIEERVREEGAARKNANLKQNDRGGNFSERGDTRDILGAMVGMSGVTYDKVKTVVRAAEAEPEHFAEAKEEMDRTGKVQPAYDKVRQLRQLREGPSSKTRVAVMTRREHIIRLGKESHTVADISAKVGIGPESVTKVLKENGIALVSDRVGKLHRPKTNETMAAIVEQAVPAENAVALVLADWESLDRSQFQGWANDLRAAVRTLSRLEKKLREELNGSSSDS